MKLRDTLLSIAFFTAFPCAVAQQPLPSPTPDLPKARIADVKKISNGGLLFAVRLYAPSSKPLHLYRPPAKRPANQPAQEGDNDPLPFSLFGSTLKDLYTQEVYQCYPSVPKGPKEPYVGPIDMTGTLAPGGWMQMGVAFPPIPPPPLDKEGKKQAYRLLFSVPELNIETFVTLSPETLKPVVKPAPTP